MCTPRNWCAVTFKIGKEQFVEKEVTRNKDKDVVVGRIPIMVKSNLCWMSEAEKGDSDFGLGGYFLVKGAEKVSPKLLFHYIPTCYSWLDFTQNFVGLG